MLCSGSEDLGQIAAVAALRQHITTDQLLRRPHPEIEHKNPAISVQCVPARGFLVFDCEVCAVPQDLAQIAASSAATAKAFGISPRVAMLSYATGQSNTGPIVDKNPQLELRNTSNNNNQTQNPTSPAPNSETRCCGCAARGRRGESWKLKQGRGAAGAEGDRAGAGSHHGPRDCDRGSDAVRCGRGPRGGGGQGQGRRVQGDALLAALLLCALALALVLVLAVALLVLVPALRGRLRVLVPWSWSCAFGVLR
eukprot:1347942-Rhodomonas_salina.1